MVPCLPCLKQAAGSRNRVATVLVHKLEQRLVERGGHLRAFERGDAIDQKEDEHAKAPPDEQHLTTGGNGRAHGW